MSMIDQIIGRKPVREDAPPVQTARPKPASPARRLPPEDKEEKKLRDAAARQRSVIAGIIGTVAESDEEAIIPSDAKRVDPFNTGQIPGMKEQPNLNSGSPAEPTTLTHGEELIPPTAALVAPDVTPNIFKLIDPSAVPQPPKPEPPPMAAPTVTPGAPPAAGAMDTILGREPGSAPAPNPGITAESFMHVINPIEVKAKAAASIVPAAEGGSPMPEHVQGDGKTIFANFRKLVG